MKLKIKKCGLVRLLNNEKVKGYYGKVVTSGKSTFDEIARESAKNTTLHPREAALAAELLLEGVCEKIKNGIIVDLGPLGTLYPAVKSKWEQDPKDLALADMQPKVNYKPSADIEAAVKGAGLSWASEADEKEGTETPDDNDNITDGGEGGDDNTGGGGGGVNLEG